MFLGTIIYAIGGVLALLLPSNANRLRGLVGVCSQILGAACILITILPVLFGGETLAQDILWSYPISNIPLRIDALDAFFLAFSIPMVCLSSIYAYSYLVGNSHKRHLGVHFCLLNLVSISFLMIYSIQNAIAFFFGWELSAISVWLLIIFEHDNQKIRFAGFNYLISTYVSLIFLIAGFMVIYANTGSFIFESFKPFLQSDTPAKNIAFILLMTSFGLKTAFFPFHAWQPRAYSASDCHVSALMSAHKAGIYGILRLIILMGIPGEWMGWFILGFSALSLFFGVMYTVAQRDMKRLFGYSSTEHMGIAGLGIGLGCLGLSWQRPDIAFIGFASALIHVLNHAFFKSLLFYVVGNVYKQVRCVDMERLGGLIKQMPYTGVSCLIGVWAISGLPPFNGFVSEFLIYTCFYKALFGTNFLTSLMLVFLVGLFSFCCAVSALSMLRIFGISFLGKPRDVNLTPKDDGHFGMIFVMGVFALGVFALGIFPTILIPFVEFPVKGLLNGLGELNLLETELMFSNTLWSIGFGSLSLVGMFIFLYLLRHFITRNHNKRTHVTWGCGYTVGNARMQYTGAAFSEPFVSVFKRFFSFKKRYEMPKGFFPKKSYIQNHCVDSMEVRIFKLLGEGEKSMFQMVTYLKEEFNFSFGIGLVFVTLVMFALIFLTRFCI